MSDETKWRIVEVAGSFSDAGLPRLHLADLMNPGTTLCGKAIFNVTGLQAHWWAHCHTEYDWCHLCERRIAPVSKAAQVRWPLDWVA